VCAMNRRLADLRARLMPTGMHPWMNPAQAELWRYDGREIYQAYERIFGCRTHGWTNLQSMHVNLPFDGDEQFARLHAAARLVLPLLPAIAASSPYAEGRRAPALDYRMEVYRANAAPLECINGLIVPETYASRREYERDLLQPIYREVSWHDPKGLLQAEWINARGAIARFDRNAIEIRVMDTQECPAADVALAALVVDAVQWLYDQNASSLHAQQAFPTERLAHIFSDCVRNAERANICDADYLALLGIERRECPVGDTWLRLADRMKAHARHTGCWSDMLAFIRSRGTLARRLLRAAGTPPNRTSLEATYRELCNCLDQGKLFDP
jgi:carboxylate-amine ligase